MKKYEFIISGKTYRRITKQAARSAYLLGKDVYIIACNLVPFTMWHSETCINRKHREQFVLDEIGVNNDFTALVNSFEYYNCRDTYTGKYAAFYIAE